MNSYNIAVIPGDGVGQEVADEAVKILKAVADKYGFSIKTEIFSWGCDYYLKHGRMMLEHLGETDSSCDIEAALSQVLKEGEVKTRDMGGNHSTSEMGDAIREAI